MKRQAGFIFPFTALIVLIFFLAVSLSAEKLYVKKKFYELLAERQATEVIVQRSMSDILMEIKEKGSLQAEGSLQYPEGTGVFVKTGEDTERIMITLFVSGNDGGRMHIQFTAEKDDGSVIEWHEGE
ncbi:competence type IV pilus minor pilin ComGG [Bacillus marinisedimentorum]|uniref:competence type IV pilus minor pilin ComGG n=1 Tax=Bacillus marinisedimentorum TaxID=1821260 RepID=UPI000872739E|nr:competence type IV pilus minor pilin ComGG [Bacillus marinisedimentorum]